MKRWMSVFLVLIGLVCSSFAQSSPYVKITGKLAGPNGLPAANDIISLTPSQSFFVAGSGTLPPCSYGAADYLFQINGVSLTPCDTLNFNGSTPATPTNGINVTFATSRSGTTDSVSAAIVGDGNVTHCLSGIGTFVACSAGGSVTGSGTSGTVPIWTSSSGLGNSPISHSGSVTSDSDAEIDVTGQSGSASHLAANNSSNDIKLQSGPGANSGGSYVEVSGATNTINLVPYNFSGKQFQVVGTSTLGWAYFPSTSFANLSAIVSAGAASGATVYVTDGTVGSHPCTGSGSGTNATYNGTAWNCQ